MEGAIFFIIISPILKIHTLLLDFPKLLPSLKSHTVSPQFSLQSISTSFQLHICFQSNMGLPPYPTPSDGGVLCVILVNTAISISIVRDIVLSILHIVGIRTTPWEEYSVESSLDSHECCGSPPETYMEEFRSRTPAVRFESLCQRPEQECLVCLTEFQPDVEINHLPCGHFFHKMCLEKWLRYWNVTCPLCRTRMVPQEEEEEKEDEDTAPM